MTFAKALAIRHPDRFSLLGHKDGGALAAKQGGRNSYLGNGIESSRGFQRIKTSREARLTDCSDCATANFEPVIAASRLGLCYWISWPLFIETLR